MDKSKKFHILCIIGTRPEIIKMAPIIWRLKTFPHIKVTVINTAQHRELIDDMLTLFKIEPDVDMNIMQHNQSLDKLTSQLFLKLGDEIKNHHYDFILAQGDTTTTFIAAQVAFYNRIPYGHVEAGLRTFDLYNPFPEEMNRVFISKLASLHFAPTYIEKNILMNEGVLENKIHVTGNTVIDSLLYWENHDTKIPFELPDNKRLILLTLHRRESFGKPLVGMLSAMLQIVNQHPDVHIVYSVHPNPNVSSLAYEMLDHHSQITLLKPQRYDVFVQLLKKAYLVCTDSGGLQEEAPALNKPVVILREETERPLIVEMGVAKIAGTRQDNIINIVNYLLSNEKAYHDMQKNMSPYGDGHAAERIVDIIMSTYINQHALSHL